MPVGNIAPPDIIHPIAGIDIGITAAGVRYKNRDDLVVFRLSASSQTAAVTTQNSFVAAPVQVLREHLNKKSPRYLVINTGNANAATGKKGRKAAFKVCEALAKLNNNVNPSNSNDSKNEFVINQTKIEQIDACNILPFSTGVIGEPLNTDAIIEALPIAIANLEADNWLRAANGIRTTDVVAKIASEKVQGTMVDGNTISYHVTGIAKGSGMIRPNMATMLAFVATDANIEINLLKRMLTSLNKTSFNRITVDGDTSTNDCCLLIATGKAGNELIYSEQHPDYRAVYDALAKVFLRLAQLVVRDGEGASKFITVKVTGGRDSNECCDVAYTVAHSPLIKTAFFASDPNWGRIVAAIGYAGVKDLDQSKVSISLDDVPICVRGQLADSYSENKGQAVMSRPEITITIDLGRGDYSDTVYTCDLSYEYIKINADYRS